MSRKVWQLLQYDRAGRVNRKWELFSLCQLTYIITVFKIPQSVRRLKGQKQTCFASISSALENRVNELI